MVKIITKYSQNLIGPGWSKFYKIRQVRGGQNYHKTVTIFDRSGVVKISQNFTKFDRSGVVKILQN